MPALIEEFLVVLAYSRRTQWALWLGVIAFAVILMAGTYFADHLSFQGLLAPVTAPLREVVAGVYEIVAWGALGMCLTLAVKSYMKDRKRLLDL